MAEVAGVAIAPPAPSSTTTAQPASSSSSPPKVRISVADASAADDVLLVRHLTGIINRVYSETEGDIFVDGYQRTNEAELRDIIRAGELAVAYLVSPNTTTSNEKGEEAIGCIRIQQLSPTTGEFGMLALDPSHRGAGLGREMVAFAERHCAGVMVAEAEAETFMQVELLVPVVVVGEGEGEGARPHAFKARLMGWYERMGYELVELGDFGEAYPHLAVLLRGPCEYRISRKRLV